MDPGVSDPKLQALAAHINARLAQPSLPAPPAGSGMESPTAAPPSIGNALGGAMGYTAPPSVIPQPHLAPLTPPSTLPLASTVGVGQAAANPGGMENYFQKESGAILQRHQNAGLLVTRDGGEEGPSKKKIFLTGVYVGGAVFLISFITLIAIRPRFVMKKVKNANGTEEHKCNFLTIFLISLILMVVVLVTAGVSVAKLNRD